MEIKLITTLWLFFLHLHLIAQEKKDMNNLILEDIPSLENELTERLPQYQNSRFASFVDWLPEEKGILIATRFGNTTQLHSVNAPLAARQQVTFFQEPVSNAAVARHADYNGFLFQKDIGGNEYSQIFWYNLEDGSHEMLSDGESVNFGVKWSNSGEQFVFTSSRRNGKDFDIYVSSIKDPKEAEMIVSEGAGGYWWVADWAVDDSKILLSQYMSINNSNAYIYDFETKKLSQINESNDSVVFAPLKWSKDPDVIYVKTDQGQLFSKLAAYNLKTKKLSYITGAIDWNIEGFAINKERSLMAFTTNENGNSQLYLMTADVKNNYQKVPDIPMGQVYGLSFHPKGESLAITLNNAQSNSDIYTLAVDSKKMERWTRSESGGLNLTSFPTPELFTYETFDEVEKGVKRTIPAYIFKPQKRSSKEPLPVIINIHGGPESQYRPYFDTFRAFLVNEMDVAMIAPNVRGSSGYGKEYVQLDNWYNREKSVQDIESLLDWIEAQPDLDASRVAVMGGSYGGYMVLSSMFNYNDRIKCGIDIVGISNFVTFLENTKSYRRDLRRSEYGDERIPEMREFLHKISPTTNADKIKKPLLVIQGANDPRVPQSEADQMVEKIRENEGVVWYMIATDEGHGFKKKDNRDKMQEVIVTFFKNFL